MGIFTNSGTTVAMTANTTAPATFDAAGYGALTYIDLGCMNNISPFGDESNLVTFDCINEGRTKKLKGQRNAGTMTLTIALDDTTTGYDNIQLAEADDSTGDYYFKVVFENPQNATGNGAIRYFGGKVMSVREAPGGADDVVTIEMVVEINTKPVKVDSTAGA